MFAHGHSSRDLSANENPDKIDKDTFAQYGVSAIAFATRRNSNSKEVFSMCLGAALIALPIQSCFVWHVAHYSIFEAPSWTLVNGKTTSKSATLMFVAVFANGASSVKDVLEGMVLLRKKFWNKFENNVTVCVVVAIVVVDSFLVPLALVIFGNMWLLSTKDSHEIILNAVALPFIKDIDTMFGELYFLVKAFVDNRHPGTNPDFTDNSEDENYEAENDCAVLSDCCSPAIGAALACTMAGVVVASVVVGVYIYWATNASVSVPKVSSQAGVPDGSSLAMARACLLDPPCVNFAKMVANISFNISAALTL